MRMMSWRLLRRRPRHVHQWVNVGYGGAGWHLLKCATCPAKEIT